MDTWGWKQLQPWLELRVQLPVGPLFCVVSGPTHGRPWSSVAARADLRRTALAAGVPVSLAGLRVAARIGAQQVEILHEGREVARHPRLDGRFQTAARLDHYLELLTHKPGALQRSEALRRSASAV